MENFYKMLVPDHFIARLQALAQQKATVNAIQVVNQKCDVSETITFSQLWKLTGALAAHFLNEGIKRGDRVMIIYPNTAQTEYLIAFLACLRVGIVPVSIYPPNPQKLDQDLIKFEHFVANSGAVRAITTSEYKRFVQLSSLTKKWAVPAKNWLATDTLINKKIKYAEQDVCFLAQDDDLMFIQYTSGSTGDPKGVPIHYKSFMTSILYGSGAFEKCYSQCPDQRMCIWVPLYHDYGLICRMMCMYSGAQLYTMDPITFLQNPIIWPQAMSKYRINFTIGPNFSYQLACRKMKEKGIKFDLSFVLQADFGAEPVHHTSPMKIHEMWGVPLESITHSYGFAEATIWVTTSASYFDPETQVAVSGDLELSKSLDMHIVIADRETGKLLPDGVTGDIFVKGRAIVKGYWNNPEASKVFDYTLDGLEGKWYLSGDLGYIKENKLYCNGRSKDVIIVNGKNIYATDLELRLEEAFATIIRPGCSAAFQVGDDEAVIICEFKPGQESVMNSDLLIKAKRDLEQEFGLQIKDIVCTLKGTVPKTTSGKIRRSESKKQYLEGNIKSNLDLSEIVICTTFDQLLKHYDVHDMSKSLIENGIDSLKLTRLMEDAKAQFDLNIDFMMAQEIACVDLEGLAKQKRANTRPIPKLPVYTVRGKRMAWFIPVQIFLILLLIFLVSVCTLPSAYLHQYLSSAELIQRYPSLIEPWLMTFSRGPGFLLIVVPVVWLVTYTALVILAKWIIIGRYKPGRVALWSSEFARWWFVDRLLEIWELFVGSYFLDTPCLNLFYKALGMNCAMTARFSCFIREADLFHVGANARVKGIVLARLMEQEGLLLDHVSIEPNLKLEARTTTYPGANLTAKPDGEFEDQTWSKSTDQTPIFEQIQRVLLPIVYMCLTTASLFFMSWVTSHYRSSDFQWEALRIYVCFYGNSILILLLSGILVRLRICDYSADRLASLCESMIGLYIRCSPIIATLHRFLYGSQVDTFTEINMFNFVPASKSRFLKTGKGTTISNCMIDLKENVVTEIGENCTIGLMTSIEAGSKIKDNSAVATLAHLSKDHEMKDNSCYFNTKFTTRNSSLEAQNWNFMDIIRPIVAVILFLWIGLFFIFVATIAFAKFVHDSISLPLCVQVPLITAITLTTAASLVLFMDILISRMFVPNCRNYKDGVASFPATSWRGAFYINHLNYHFIADVFVSSFLKGTGIAALIQIGMGTSIAQPWNTVIMGIFCDSNNLFIAPSDPSNSEIHFVSDLRSYFEAHRIENGYMKFEMSRAIGNVSLHPASVVMGQKIDNVTIGKRTRVLFTKKVGKNTSGFYYGVPGVECDEQPTLDSDVITIVEMQ